MAKFVAEKFQHQFLNTEAVGGGYCRLQMPLRLALGSGGTVAEHRLGALGEGGCLSPFQGITAPPPPPCVTFRPSLASLAAKFGTNSQIVAQEQASTVNGRAYFLWACGWLLLFLRGL